jgi:hypothetical protein
MLHQYRDGYLVPSHWDPNLPPPPPMPNLHHPSSASSLTENGTKRKKTAVSCDQCRQAKEKCDGRHQCARCIKNNQYCVYSYMKRNSQDEFRSKALEGLESVQGAAVEFEQRLIKAGERIKNIQQSTADIEHHPTSKGAGNIYTGSVFPIRARGREVLHADSVSPPAPQRPPSKV